MTNISTLDEVIDRLGGVAAVREMFDLSYNAPYNWRRSGTFPAYTYLAMTSELERHGYSASPKLWNMA